MDEARDEKLRHSLLTAARIVGATTIGGWTGALTLIGAARDDRNQIADDDAHGQRLLLDLVSYGLLEEEMNPNSGPKSLRHRRFRQTKKAFELWMRSIPPQPGVWDERLEG